MKYVLCANESAGLNAFKLLLNRECNISAVLTPVENIRLRKMAAEKDIRVMDPDHLGTSTFADWIRQHGIDVILNVHLLHIIHADVLDAAAVGCYNLHPGKLPQYAGLNTPSWAIFNGEKEQTVTVHRMEPGVDTGPVAYEKSFSVRNTDTGYSLSARSAEVGIEILNLLIDQLEQDPQNVPAVTQDISERKTYYKKDRPLEGIIGWNAPAHRIDAMIRAYSYAPFTSPWGSPRALVNGETVEIVSAELTAFDCSEVEPGIVRISSADDVYISTLDYWIRIKTVAKDGLKLPASKLLSAIVKKLG